MVASAKFKLPYVNQLLISGGDERLALNQSGVNKYGCAPSPNDAVLSFSSSTASSLSSHDFVLAENYRLELEKQLVYDTTHVVFKRESERLCLTWRELSNLPETNHFLLSASGTDVHQLVANCLGGNALIIMVETNETGSGIKQALDVSRQNKIVLVSLRLGDGQLRSADDVDNEVEILVQQANEKNQQVLLVMVDQSKTGLIAPSYRCAVTLKNRFENTLTVLVDSCQFRLSTQTLKAYLHHDFIVALTGSKFLAAPSFSAMLVFPERLKSFFTNLMVPPNFGLLVRNQIALTHYQSFSVLSNEQIYSFVDYFSKKMDSFLNENSYFQRLSVPPLVRGTSIDILNWDTLPTIFPFVLYKNNKPLSHFQTSHIYQQLPKNSVQCEVGQPVSCGSRQNKEVSALRLCLSSQLIVRATENVNNAEKIVAEALRVLETIAELV